MTLVAVAALLLHVQAETPRRDLTVRHSDIGCWVGERTWTANDEPPSQMVVFRTDGDDEPSRIGYERLWEAK